VLGTAENLKSIALIRKMVVGFRHEINNNYVGLKENQSRWQIYRGTTSSESLLTATHRSRIREQDLRRSPQEWIEP
jgi:hypothetical protein